MTAWAWSFAGLFTVAAGANWWSRLSEARRRTELWSKPLALIALIGVAIALDPVDSTVRAWFVVALVCSLAGDVFLLDGDRRFVPGLAAFLAAHVAYTIGMAAGPEWSWAGFAVGVASVSILVVVVGWRIVLAAGRKDPVLGPAVVAYLLAISVMFCAAVATGSTRAIVGAALFVASDSILGWGQFVARAPWMPVAIMVTYHLGQAGLVASLL